MFAQFAIGFVSGLFVGIAVFSHVLSRAVVVGIIAGIIIGAIVVDGPDGYVRWAMHLPVEMTRLSTFWIGLIAGLLGGVTAERRFL
jgi:hypothetical protein